MPGAFTSLVAQLGLIAVVHAIPLAAWMPPVPPHLRMMTIYGYNAQLQAGWNTQGVSRNLSELVAGYAYSNGSLPGLLRLDGDLLFVTSEVATATSPTQIAGDSGGSQRGTHMTLRADWRARWEGAFATALPHLRNGVLQARGLSGMFVVAVARPGGQLRAMLVNLVHYTASVVHSPQAAPFP